MVEGMQPDECTPEVSWEVSWESKLGGIVFPSVERRDQGTAIALAREQRAAGFKTKLRRVEKTEIDF